MRKILLPGSKPVTPYNQMNPVKRTVLKALEPLQKGIEAPFNAAIKGMAKLGSGSTRKAGMRSGGKFRRF